MTDGAIDRGHAAMAGYQVMPLTDRRQIEARLSEDRAFSAYALGHLEPQLFAQSQYWGADGPTGHATVMHSNALGSVTVAVGEAEAVAAILSLHPGPRLGYLSTGAPEHLPALRRSHLVTDTLQMVRMSTTSFSFQDVDPVDLRPLQGRDVARLNALYGTEGGPTHYSAEAVDRAIYYGAFDGDRLVSVAGTHVASPHQSIAVLGNVFTHPRYRGRGLAKQVTAAVTRELLARGCGEVVLTVNPENTPAVAAYSTLGYRQGSAVVEARLERRDLLGLSPLWRRFMARRRGRPDGDHIEWVGHRPPR
ncbi:MAG: GNAT family N-acetyltransferase [Dehalococcoidia bacterium]|nr:GNAT family N-acetyltransferase [Dehalococcoidia bacterium]